MQWTRISRKFVEVPVTAALADGSPAVLAGVDVALLERNGRPTDDTTWTPATYGDGVARILVAGPDADPAGALVLTDGGADVWVRISDNPEVDAAKAGSIVVG